MLKRMVAICCLALLLAAPAAAQKRAVAVASAFENLTNVPALGQTAAEVFSAALAQNGSFLVVERVNVAKLLREQSFGRTGFVSDATAVRFKNLEGAHYLAIGQVTDAGLSSANHLLWDQSKARVTLVLKIVDAETGVLVYSDQQTGEVSKTYGKDEIGRVAWGAKVNASHLTEACRKAAAQLAARLPAPTDKPVGTVVLKSGGCIYLDFAATPGQRFQVTHRGGPIYHPDTGELLGQVTTPIGTVEVISCDGKLATARFLSEAGYIRCTVGDSLSREW